MLTPPFDFLLSAAEIALKRTQQLGAEALVHVHESVGLTVTVRHADLETIEHHRDRGLSITLYHGHKTGHAASSDLSRHAIEQAVATASAIARHTAEDPAAGMPDPSWLADPDALPDLDLFHPWPIDAEAAIDLARAAEASGLAVSGIVNSEGATCTTGYDLEVIASTLGFLGTRRHTLHTLSVVLLARSDDGDLVRDGAWASRRAPVDLPSPETIGRQAAERALQRRNARPLPTGSYPIIFDAEVAPSLLGHFVAAASGGALYRRASFLLDRFEELLFPSWFSLYEDPFLPRALASTPFDDEGVRLSPRPIVAEGRWVGRFLSTYSARKLGLSSTGNAGGAHNLLPTPTHPTRDALLRAVGRGLLITELLGHGVNTVTGEYSRGAAGFWVENGEIAFPVHEVTVAGLLQDFFRDLVGIADDARPDRRIRLGTTAIAAAQIAGGGKNDSI
ncbi:MAG: metallopeptidase TldD-related protein [Hydrogenophilus sp.]|nr:metallopeptidase TldD-related protein [Hydrogenophilus sp.]